MHKYKFKKRFFLKNALDQMLANTDRKLLLLDEKYAENHNKKEQIPCLSDHLVKTSNNCSEASSLTSSSANSPGVNQPSPLLSSGSSTSSSSSSIFTKDSQSSQSSCSTMNKNKQSTNALQMNTSPASTELPLWLRKEEKNVEITVKQEQVILNNEGSVKKIISRFLSQAPSSKNSNFNTFQQQHNQQVSRPILIKENELNVASSPKSTLLTISSKQNQTTDTFKPSTKCIYYTEKSSAPFMVTIFKR